MLLFSLSRFPGLGPCLLTSVLLIFTPGCQERVIRDSRFSAFAARHGTQEPVAEKPAAPTAPLSATPLNQRLADYDLSQFAGQPRYSLQIGYWDETYRGDFRKAAEQQVLKLRGEGVQAYLFHGPIRSLVCVELFEEADLIRRADGSTEYGPRIVALQKQFPYNLANGEPFKLMIFGRPQENPQPSFIIQMPRSDQVARPPSPPSPKKD